MLSLPIFAAAVPESEPNLYLRLLPFLAPACSGFSCSIGLDFARAPPLPPPGGGTLGSIRHRPAAAAANSPAEAPPGADVAAAAAPSGGVRSGSPRLCGEYPRTLFSTPNPSVPPSIPAMRARCKDYEVVSRNSVPNLNIGCHDIVIDYSFGFLRAALL